LFDLGEAIKILTAPFGVTVFVIAVAFGIAGAIAMVRRDKTVSTQAEVIRENTVTLKNYAVTLERYNKNVIGMQNELDRERDARREDTRKSNFTLETLTAELKTIKEETIQQRTQIETLRHQIAEKDKQIEKLQGQVNALEEENCTLKAERIAQMGIISDMQRTLVVSEQRGVELANQIGELKKRGTGPLQEQASSGAVAPESVGTHEAETPRVAG
jgi:chromosome segregation ATPase